MPAHRRPHLDDRRRLVIYSQRLSAEPATGTSRRRGRGRDAAEAVRGERQAYGLRVHRRLRARWYGLVPARRRSMWTFGLAVAGLVVLLGLGHWAAFWWGPLASRAELARPLRLDRIDSIGSWLSTLMLVCTAGLSFLVYQLRRYRADDYHGHYRIWRVAILVLLFASADGVIDGVGWLGAGLDVLLAEREVLAGADWIRLLLCVGGLALGMRMTGEVSRDRTATMLMVTAVILLAIPMAVRWNLLEIEVWAAATWLPIFQLAARAALFIAVMSYLRLLYREVRRMEAGPSVQEWLRGLVPSAPWTEEGWEAPWARMARGWRREEGAGFARRKKVAAAEVDNSEEELEEATGTAGRGRFWQRWKLRGEKSVVEQVDPEEDEDEDTWEAEDETDRDYDDERYYDDTDEDEGEELDEGRAESESNEEAEEAEPREGVWSRLAGRVRRPSLKLRRNRRPDGLESDEVRDAEELAALEDGDAAEEDEAGAGAERSRKRRLALPKWKMKFPKRAAKTKADVEDAGEAIAETEPEEDAAEESQPRRRRGLSLFKRRGRSDSVDGESVDGGDEYAEEADASDEERVGSAAEEKRARSWKLRLPKWKRKTAEDGDAEGRSVTADEGTAETERAGTPEQATPRLSRRAARAAARAAAREEAEAAASGGSGRNGDSDDAEYGYDDDAASTEYHASAGAGASGDEYGESDEEWLDPDEIDWSSLSKAERRRVRKQLKRQGRAA